MADDVEVEEAEAGDRILLRLVMRADGVEVRGRQEVAPAERDPELLDRVVDVQLQDAVRREVRLAERFEVLLAAVVFVAHIVDIWWLVAPSLYPRGFHFSWVAPVAFIGVGGIWLNAFLRRVQATPLVPMNDPRLVVAVPT